MGTKDESLAAAFGELLRQMRVQAALTLAELGAKVEPPMQAQAIARYEAGGRGPTLALLYRLAVALGIEPRELLPPLVADEPTPPKKGGRKK
jgi:transcriptional regulator with XRE-family HTH domain